MLPIAILAGGFATRMRPLTSTTPKALLHVAGKPFLFHQLDMLQSQNAQTVILCTGFLGDQIIDAVTKNNSWKLDIFFSDDGERPLGTGGAIKKAASLLRSDLLVLYGDSWLQIDFGKVSNYFQKTQASSLMTVYNNNNQFDASNVYYKDGNVIAYDKKTIIPEMQHIDYGLGGIRFNSIKTWPDTFDLSQYYTAMAKQGQLAGYETTQRFYEIGSKLGYEELQRLFSGNYATNAGRHHELQQ